MQFSGVCDCRWLFVLVITAAVHEREFAQAPPDTAVSCCFWVLGLQGQRSSTGMFASAWLVHARVSWVNTLAKLTDPRALSPTWSICLPHPLQVGFLQTEHSACTHILKRRSLTSWAILLLTEPGRGSSTQGQVRSAVQAISNIGDRRCKAGFEFESCSQQAFVSEQDRKGRRKPFI